MNPKVIYLATHPRQALLILGGFLIIVFAAIGGVSYLLTESLLSVSIVLGVFLVLLLGGAVMGTRKAKVVRDRQQEQMNTMMQMLQGGIPGFGAAPPDEQATPPGDYPQVGIPDPAALSKMFETLSQPPAADEKEPPASKS